MKFAGESGLNRQEMTLAFEVKGHHHLLGLIPVVSQVVGIPELSGSLYRTKMLGNWFPLISWHIVVVPLVSYHER
jgi:hypothetical protein